MRIFWLDREEALKRVEEAARRLLAEKPEVREVVLFGSLAEGRAVPGSDVDLLIILSKSEKDFLSRKDDYLTYFSDVGLPCDLFCYTEEEIKNNPFARDVLQRGIRLSKNCDDAL